PIVVINSGGQNIDSAFNDIVVWMGVIDNGYGNRNYLSNSFNSYNGKISLNLRGSSKMFQPKKSFKISFIDSLNNNIEQSIFGMPPENDWVLEGIYNDKSLIRNAVTYDLFREMGHYAPRYKFVELIVDGDYKGIYGFTEKIKRDNYRVNISKLLPNEVSGDDLTGGYIFKLDHYLLPYDTGWYSSFASNVTSDSSNYFLYYYPKPGSMPQIQKDYLKNYVDHFESVLASSWFNNQDSGYIKYIDLNSFLDYFIINEMSRNVDGFRLSSYFYKDKDSKGGKLFCGPVWDYDLGWDNCALSGGHNPSGWQYQQFYLMNYIPFWWWQFLSDPYFNFELRCRYQLLRSVVLDDNSIYAKIDSMSNYLNEAQVRNFIRWPILGQVIYPAPSPAPLDFGGEIQLLKNWVNQRLAWLDANIPGQCITNTNLPFLNEKKSFLYPNPTDDKLKLDLNNWNKSIYWVRVIDFTGREYVSIVANSKNSVNGIFEIDCSGFNSGIYLLELFDGGNKYYNRFIKN
ncbi:MAG: CotH kinase family protein, partial [Bacteroidota bacterium]